MFQPREAKKDFLYSKMAVFVLAFAVAAFFAVWSYQQGVEYGLISLSPSKSSGRITSVDSEHWTVTFHFKYEDEQLNTRYGRLVQRNYGSASRRMGLTSKLSTGDDVSVLYLSFYPDVAQLELQLPKQALSFYILIVCFFVHIATVTLGLRTIRQINQHASEDIYY